MRVLIVLCALILPFAGSRPSGSPDWHTTQLEGIDVSHHQSRINWDAVASSHPLRFAFVKATEGADFTDSLFCENWESLRRLGMQRGAYHFFHAYGCGEDQARHFLSTIEMQAGDLAPVLDLETTDGMPPETMIEEARIWLQIVEEHLGVKPIIYSNQDFYEKYLAGIFNNHPLWIAKYSAERPALLTGKTWDFWQYSNEGRIKGVSGKVDRNVFSGTQEMLNRLCYQPNAVQPAAQPAP